MAKRGKKKSRISAKKRKRIIRAYILRTLLLAVVVLMIIVLLKGVAHIFRPAPDAGTEASTAGEAPEPAGEGADTASPGSFFGLDIGHHAGEARHSLGGQAQEEAEDKGEAHTPISESINVDGAGRVKATSEEPIEEGLYSEEELESAIQGEIDSYNRISADGVSLESLKLSKGVARTVIKYASSADYRGFNGVGLYVGTVDELSLQGVGYDKELLPASGQGSSIPAGSTGEISRGGLITLAVDESMSVKVPGRIMYVSGDVRLTGGKSAECHAGSGYSFIVYKKPFLNIF